MPRLATNPLLPKLKLYFGISDSSKDDIINLIINQDTELCEALGIDTALLYSMCVEDYSLWLKSGNSAFKTSQASEGINRYSPDLREMISMSIKVVVY